MQSATDAGNARLDRVTAQGVSPLTAGVGSLLGSAGSVMSNWYQYRAFKGV